MDQHQAFADCCLQPLFTDYDLSAITHHKLHHRRQDMWRYHELLPVQDSRHIVSLGEGWTPLRKLSATSQALGLKHLLLKDESTNPTGSFKARGISVAISRLKELGIEKCIMPTAGNAGGALSAYAAKAGIQATVVMPRHSAETLKAECDALGAELILVDGLIDACGKKAREIAAQSGATDLSTLKEPYRLEGKKTLGYEIAEQLGWQLPDVIIYPTGGGTGLIGMWKAFQEMRTLGWITGKMPRMIIVQSENCNPMIQMFDTGMLPDSFEPAPSVALGLAVPSPFAKDQIQKTVRESSGTAVNIREQDLATGIREFASREGILLSPEGSAAYMGLKKLIEKDYIQEDETVVLFNTGSWYKYR